ncbi:MAG: hypothetical protein JST52_00665 [Bacteroidetes bacterium]|nr:hypothetical protein [Bacteroidota bacterium]MBS1739333.1 hypothetical protein [Bacteroidota bacterium]
MKQYLRSSALILATALAFAACKKESKSDGVFPPADSTNSKLILSNLFGGTQTLTPVQTFEVKAGDTQVVRTAMNTKLSFYKNSFKDKNGNIIISGQIVLKVIEMYNSGHVVANRSSTVSFGRPMTSAGQIYIKAYRGGQEVFANVYGLGFNTVATSQNPPFQLFYGSKLNPDSTVTWAVAPNGLGTISSAAFTDTSVVPNVSLYQFDSCRNFNWVGGHYYYDLSGQLLTNAHITVKDTFGLNKTNTQLFVVFPSINGVSYMQLYDTAMHTWSLSPNYEIPTNMQVHFVSLSLVKGLYYYDEHKFVNITYGYSDTLRPQPKTLPDVLTALSNL